MAMGYAAPAVMAGIGGVVTANPELRFGAFTTIGGMSAVAALLIGLLLMSGVGRMRWVAEAPLWVVVGGFAALGCGLGLGSAGLAADFIETMFPNRRPDWTNRIPTDFPLSGFLAGAIVTWRWRAALANQTLPKRSGRT